MMGRLASILVVVGTLLLGACSAGAEPQRSENSIRREAAAVRRFADPRVARLAHAACEGDTPAIEQALRDGADPNYSGLEGITPLHWASICDNFVGARALLVAGADPNLVSGAPSGNADQMSEEASPTLWAAGSHNPAMLPLFLQHGGDPNAHAGDDPSVNALERALDVGNVGHGWDNWNALLAAGADIEQHDNDGLGHTIAASAMATRAWDRVIELLNRGYDYRLDVLAYALQLQMDRPLPPELIEKGHIIRHMLEAHGIVFPVRPPWERR